ncbi:alpha/beta hydrolase [Streptomyces samsunensis]|uniref:Alpha/beta hydrolase n=2 Tax=Streptomyces malaysiensis TaxID=92644 RepID=A0A291SYR8_STRMQ|nr:MULTISPECIES: alpha/beta hydrolase [Streptomyces]MYX56090.1 alpha/beta fold hydrolase [Streptomyces sp. SID8382]ATL86038.1 hydrolase [Streptomyces malaysiensis]AUA10703.1 Alpha/beta hydrolase family protein [Streptomyces sp. M56]MCC4318437.1 alpha/beta hydrolase [Streptomyces malaysiensis]MCM3810734.1 alpha/beta hydrolase [Streptomyces sp. DR7-3]
MALGETGAAGDRGLAQRPLLLRHRPARDATRLRALFLHGLASSGAVWDGLAPHLPPDLETWTADLPWRADHVQPWSRRPERTDWIVTALERLPDPPDVVVAHSFSANQLLDLLSREAEAGNDPYERYGIRGVVLVSPFYRRSPDDFAWDSVSGMQRDFLHIMEEGLRTHSARRITPEVRRHMAERVCERVGPYGWVRFFEHYLRTPWLRTELITVPGLVVTGQDDFAAAESALLAADLPGAGLHTVPGCGHYPMSEHAESFSALVGAFLGRLPDRAAPHLTEK